MKNKTYKILGLMSGTSMDGLDCCLCDLSIDKNYNLDYKIIDFDTFYYKPKTIQLIKDAIKNPHKTNYCSDYLGKEFSEIASDFLKNRIIDLVGTHGQTVQHIDKKMSKQIGNPIFLLKKLNIPIVYNFRQNDIKYGGNGAPLMPFLDWLIFKNNQKDTYTLNIGGISNLSKISNHIERHQVIGFDTGPGMSLIDEFVNKVWGENMDLNGKFSSNGTIIDKLENQLLAHPFINKAPPKSTGRDEFGYTIINEILQKYNNYSNKDILRTLIRFTAKSIFINLKKHLKFNSVNFDFYVNGGGAHHPLLIKDLKNECQINTFSALENIGFNEDNKEALLISVLALCKFLNIPANMPNVTGSKGNIILGDILFNKD